MRRTILLAVALFLSASGSSLCAAAMPHYNVAATIDPIGGALSATVTITTPASELQPETVFLLGGTYAISVSDAGPEATVEVSPAEKPFQGLQRIAVRLKSTHRGPLRLRLRYAGRLGPSGDPPLNLLTRELIELNLDSLWVPIKDGFTSKFTLSAEIQGVPEDLVVIAPGTVRRSGKRVLIRRDTGQVDVAFAAMRGLRRISAEGFELYSADVSGESSSVYLRHGSGSIGFLESWFGGMPAPPRAW